MKIAEQRRYDVSVQLNDIFETMVVLPKTYMYVIAYCLKLSAYLSYVHGYNSFSD